MRQGNWHKHKDSKVSVLLSYQPMDGWKILILMPGGLQVPLSLPIEEKKISATPPAQTHAR